MVEEEGEVFRKGNALLGPEELEGEYDGEELRIEVIHDILCSNPHADILQLLEAEVERPPPRSISIDEEFISELPPLPMSPALDGEAAAGQTVFISITYSGPVTARRMELWGHGRESVVARERREVYVEVRLGFALEYISHSPWVSVDTVTDG